MDSINIYRGIASFLIAIWGTFAWMPDSKTKNNTEHVRNSVLVDFAPIAPSTTIFMLPTESDPSILPIPLVSFWENMAQCETLNNWKHKGKNGAGHYYEGGLGIYDDTWDNWGGEEFANHAYGATKGEQIIVANRIALFGYKTVRSRDPEWAKLHGAPINYLHKKDAAGFNGWGCNRDNGAPPLFYYPDPERFLTTRFEFDQRGVEVHDLQQLLGVKADGWYGKATQSAHLKYLNRADLPTNVVPLK